MIQPRLYLRRWQTTRQRLLVWLVKRNTMKKSDCSKNARRKSKRKEVSRQLLVQLTREMLHWKTFNSHQASSQHAVSEEASYQEVKSRELPLPELSSGNQRSWSLTRLLLHWTRLHKRRFKVLWLTLWRAEPPSLLHTEWVPSKDVTKSLFLRMVSSRKKVASKL